MEQQLPFVALGNMRLQFPLRVLLLVVTVACIALAFYRPQAENSREAQAGAVNEALISAYPKGADFKTIPVDFDILIGHKVSEFPRVFRVADPFDVSAIPQILKDNRPNFAANEKDSMVLWQSGVPEYAIRVWDKYGADSGLEFYHLYTFRGALTGYDAYVDDLVLCVDNDKIVGTVEASIMDY